jgi:uncharacterized membrane protein
LIHRIRYFWLQSYRSDRKAFYVELMSLVFTVAGSLILATTSQQPNMVLVYPLFLIGSVSQCYASMRRGLIWAVLLTAYFACVNVFGFGRALDWW